MAIIAAAAIAAGLARTSRPPPAAAGPEWTVEHLPADVRLAVRIADADRQRNSAPGNAVAAALAQSGRFSETIIAWKGLADRLGWAPDEALSRLAGRRVVLAVAGELGSPAAPWALLSDVDAQAERALRKALRPAPRATIQGQPVLSLEDGKFELAVVCSIPRESRKGPAAVRTLILAPTGRGDLLERTVRSLTEAPGARALAETAAWRAVHALPNRDVLILIRPPDPAGERFIALSASLVEGGWDAAITASPDLVNDARAGDRCRPAWSAEPVRKVAAIPGALLSLQAEWGEALLGILPPDVRDRLRGLVGSRVALAVFEGGGADAALTICGGVAAPDAGALAAPGDAVMSLLLRTFDTGSSLSPDFEGFVPEAPRVVPAPVGLGASLGGAFGPAPRLAWVYARAKGGGPGWWLVGIGPADQSGRARAPDRITDLAAILADSGPGDCRPRLLVAEARIGELVRHMPPWADGVLSPLRCIDSAALDAWLSPSGAADGTLRLRIAPVQ